MKIDFLSAYYGCRLFSPQKFLSFAFLKHNPEIHLDKFQAWLEYQTGKLYAKQTGSSTASVIMKTARDKQLDFCSSFRNEGYYIYLVRFSLMLLWLCTVCKFAASKHCL